MNVYTTVSSVLFLVNLLLAAAVIFLERRNVGVTWAWLLVLFFLPGLGFLLYLLLGQNLSRRKIYHITDEYAARFRHTLEAQKKELPALPFRSPETGHYRNLIHMNLASGYSLYTEDNEVAVFTDGRGKFDALLEDIRNAKRHVHLMYYIYRADGLGERLREALAAKAAEGVEVRVLVDHVGSSKLPRRFFDALKRAGGEAAAFFPSRIPYFNVHLNYRNHRKLAIIDGGIGYIGGFNVGDEYLGLNPRFGYWRDTHLRIRGSAVGQMQAHFLLDWSLASGRELPPASEYFPDEGHEGFSGLQILASGPNHAEDQIKNAYIKMIHSAERSVYIQTPYFIPDESIFAAIKIAAYSGVDVKIMLPARPDHRLVYWASLSYLDQLLEAGVSCYLYEAGFLHAKTIVVDGKAASVGTANVDIRSFKLNFEINALIFDPAKAAELEQIFRDDLTRCRRLTLDAYQRRPWTSRFMESCARLLSPIL